jgi:ArsR family metal-binding transcriptional regulator
MTEAAFGAGFLTMSRIEELLPRTEAFATADLNPMKINQAIRTAEDAPSPKECVRL